MISGCTRLFFYPLTQFVSSPSDYGFRYDEVQIAAHDGVKLHGWFVYPESKPLGTIYFLHGNAENISTHTRSVYWLVDEGYQVFALDYRGFGKSEGIPDVDEVLSDIDAGALWLAQHLQAEHSAGPVFLLGQSMGGTLAIRYLDLYRDSAAQFDALVSEAAFSSYGLIGRQVAAKNPITWVLQYPVQWILPQRHDPIKAIQRLQDLPIYIVHSVDDTVVPYMHGPALWAKANQDISSFESTTGRHISAFQHEDIREGVLGFFDAHR